MNYTETLEYLFSRLPMFHRIGAAAYKADLNNIISLTDKLGNPQTKFKTVHIAGTNGKGSVSNMLASVFMEAGYKTGLFTSPHLIDFRERIRINGEMIPEEEVIRFVEEYDDDFKDVNPSFFEWTTALAFSFFEKQNVDIAIIETGLGGRLDSTNIISPELSVITNISYDHMYLLGDTLEKIAFEKAGIIKKDIPVVIGERQSETEKVFITKANNEGAQIVFASDHYSAIRKSIDESGQEFEIKKDDRICFDSLQVSLAGNYQRKNICTVLQSVELLKKKFLKLDDNSFVKGVGKVQLNSGLRGRWEVLKQDPLTIADIGHNEAGIAAVVSQLSELRNTRPLSKLHIVFGLVNDKDADHVLSLLPKEATYYFCRANLPRALEVEALAAKAANFGLKGEKYPSVSIAYNSALKDSNSGDIVFIGGSTFVVAEVLQME